MMRVQRARCLEAGVESKWWCWPPVCCSCVLRSIRQTQTSGQKPQPRPPPSLFSTPTPSALSPALLLGLPVVFVVCEAGRYCSRLHPVALKKAAALPKPLSAARDPESCLLQDPPLPLPLTPAATNSHPLKPPLPRPRLSVFFLPHQDRTTTLSSLLRVLRAPHHRPPCLPLCRPCPTRTTRS
jgi:hypothetical protein